MVSAANFVKVLILTQHVHFVIILGMSMPILSRPLSHKYPRRLPSYELAN